MGIIENIIKEAEQQVLQPDATPPVVSGAVVDKDDVEKVASVLEKVGNLYKLGQDPDVALVPPVSGEQKPAAIEAKKVQAIPGSVQAEGQVSLVPPVPGEQQEAAPDPKVAEWKQRMRKVATEALMKSDSTQEPGNVGLTAPAPDQTGFSDDGQKLVATGTGKVEESNTVKPMTPLLNEPPKTSDEEMAAALPQATKSPATVAATAGGESKTAALNKEAQDEVMGRISAHSFLDELTAIYNGGE